MGINDLILVVSCSTWDASDGGGENDLNLLSSIESNSANCSMVLDDISGFGFVMLT